jgi:hypothetical protein
LSNFKCAMQSPLVMAGLLGAREFDASTQSHHALVIDAQPDATVDGVADRLRPRGAAAAYLASLALVYVARRGNAPRRLLWVFAAIAFAGFAAMLPISAAFVGTSMPTFNRPMPFQNWI